MRPSVPARATRLGSLIAVATAGALTLAMTLTACGGSGTTTIVVSANAVAGGKNASTALWWTKWIIPRFVQEEKAKGRTVHVMFEGSGAPDEAYKTKIALELKTSTTPDVLAADGIWVGEFAQAGYIKPLSSALGSGISGWNGWAQMSAQAKDNMTYNGALYGMPLGVDGRVIYFNKKLFTQAGLPVNWQPASWNDILSAAGRLKRLPGVTPIELDAGNSSSMGEATTTQGFLPLLAGTGHLIYENGKWLGNTPAVRSVLTMYQQVYGTALGDAREQLRTTARDDSFASFAGGKTGMLIESDYFWRDVVNPSGGIDPMNSRDSAVGWALIPAQSPGSGLRNQDYVSMSGGTGYVVNPRTTHRPEVTDLMELIGSPAAQAQAARTDVEGLSPRNDVNSQVFGGDPLMTFISQKVMPVTAFRPSSALYPQVSVLLQNATEEVLTGKSAAQAAADYQAALVKVVGAGNVASG